MKISRLLTNICSNQIAKTKEFYTKLFDFEIQFDSDWFVNLVADKMEIGIIAAENDIVPDQTGSNPGGIYLTFVVEDADEAFNIATTEGFTVISPPHDTAYGQRRLIVEDPNGLQVDISSPIPGFQF